MSYSVAVAGTTNHTLLCTQALSQHTEFEISFIITPEAKPIGRKQLLTPNPIQKFADSNQIPIVLIKNRVDESVKNKILAHRKPDFLLVVDFGYLVPKWLLDLPKIMPINIHPSALPKWRGSSPAQFVLLAGEKTSAVSIIQMTSQFDQGPIIWQQQFKVNQNWTQTEYYQHSFQLATQNLTTVMLQLAEKKITPTPQPLTSPTPLAKKINKQDSFVSWERLKKAMESDSQLASQLEKTSRAYSPWPLLWTEIPTNKGKKRMQILKTKLENQLLELVEVKIEGLSAKPWTEVKNSVSDL